MNIFWIEDGCAIVGLGWKAGRRVDIKYLVVEFWGFGKGVNSLGVVCRVVYFWINCWNLGNLVYGVVGIGGGSKIWGFFLIFWVI